MRADGAYDAQAERAPRLMRRVCCPQARAGVLCTAGQVLRSCA